MRGDETPRKKEAEKRIIVRSRKEKRQIYNEGRAERDSDNINMKPVKDGKAERDSEVPKQRQRMLRRENGKSEQGWNREKGEGGRQPTIFVPPPPPNRSFLHEGGRPYQNPSGPPPEEPTQRPKTSTAMAASGYLLSMSSTVVVHSPTRRILARRCCSFSLVSRFLNAGNYQTPWGQEACCSWLAPPVSLADHSEATITRSLLRHHVHKLVSFGKR